jgi:hypothetical protein
MSSIIYYFLCGAPLAKAVVKDIVLPKLFPQTTKPYYGDNDDEWVDVDVDDNFSAETVTSDDEGVLVPRTDVELLPM